MPRQLLLGQTGHGRHLNAAVHTCQPKVRPHQGRQQQQPQQPPQQQQQQQWQRLRTSLMDAIATPPMMGSRVSRISGCGCSPKNSALRATLKAGSMACSRSIFGKCPLVPCLSLRACAEVLVCVCARACAGGEAVCACACGVRVFVGMAWWLGTVKLLHQNLEVLDIV